ncbi:hypothetical protein [Bacillus toyonensis]|uniref:hypothetical protein n=1 Tax=Bacillus toyonensis TaxID=155322 RepID=UPI002E245E1C|nr:hypothetical protein [Bacillus toyonensis]
MTLELIKYRIEGKERGKGAAVGLVKQDNEYIPFEISINKNEENGYLIEYLNEGKSEMLLSFLEKCFSREPLEDYLIPDYRGNWVVVVGL